MSFGQQILGMLKLRKGKVKIGREKQCLHRRIMSQIRLDPLPRKGYHIFMMQAFNVSTMESSTR